jgi:hypothetical protein
MKVEENGGIQVLGRYGPGCTFQLGVAQSRARHRIEKPPGGIFQGSFGGISGRGMYTLLVRVIRRSGVRSGNLRMLAAAD